MKPWEKYQENSQDAPWLKYQAAEQKPEQPERPQITGGRGIAGQRVQQQAFDEQQALDTFNKIQAGEMSAADLQPEQVEAIRKARINALPELKGLGANVDFGSALAGMTAFDPAEMGAIISKSDPNIGVVTTPDGETIAVNNQTGAAVNLNKAGPSMTDALQFGGAIAAFAPASRAVSLPAMAGAGMGTQALIETGQELAGGEFNPGEVALAGAAPVVMAKAGQGIKAGIGKLRGRSPAVTSYFGDAAQNATKQAEGMDLTPIEQQSRNNEFLQAVNRPEQKTEVLTPAMLPAAQKEVIRTAIREGTIESAGYSIDKGTGKLVADKLERDLLKKNISPNLVVAPKSMSTGDIKGAYEMVQKAENFIRGVKGSETDLPQGVVGRMSLERINTIENARKEASKRIGLAVRNELKGQQVDVSDVFQTYLDDLAELRIYEVDGALNFDQSMIAGNKEPYQKLYTWIKSGVRDASEAHKDKQSIASRIYNESKSQNGMDDRGKVALERARDGINKKLRVLSDEYADANDDFSSAISVLKPITDKLNKNIDLETAGVDQELGLKLRRIITNYGDSNELANIVNDLDRVARQFGGEFDNDIMAAVMWNAELQKAFGSFKPGSMQGIIESGTETALDRAGLTGQVIKAGITQGKDRLMFTPPSKEKLELIKQLKELLSR